MKRISAFLLAIILISIYTIPVAADKIVRDGEQISLWSDITVFPANTPFHIEHGFQTYLLGTINCSPDPTTSPNPHGLMKFKLDVDGVNINESFIERRIETCGGPPNHILNFIFNFPNGMSGSHTFTGHWIMPCQDAVERGYLPGPCEKQNEKVEAITKTITVYFGLDTLSKGLIAYYPFDGNANDMSGNGNNGLVYGAILTQDRFGKPDSAYSFNGQDEYIDFPGVTSNLASGSIALWFCSDGWHPSGDNGNYIFAGMYGGNVGDGVNLGTHPYYVSDQSLLFGVYELHPDLSGVWHWAHSAVVPQAGSWYFLVGTWGADGVKIYVNGELKGTEPYTGPAPQAESSRAGASHWDYTGVNGTIDDIRIFNRALTADEVNLLNSLP